LLTAVRSSVPVAGNLATPPAELAIEAQSNQSAAQVSRLLAFHLPVSITESGLDGSAVATLARPVSLIPDAIGSFRFERKVLTSRITTTTSGTVSGSSGSDASCSVRTHRCVAVVVTTACDIHGRCNTTRTIHRYRYAGTRPPAGTTGPDTQPTAPIVGRTNQLVKHAGKLTLVLRGAPQRRVVVLLSVSCTSHNTSAIGGDDDAPLEVAVPSRTPITLPGPARSFQSCDVGALANSHQTGSVVVTVARS
jgi:hypothetical protein